MHLRSHFHTHPSTPRHPLRAAADGDTPLVGYCRGSDSAIQACVWTPGPPKNSGSSGKKDKGKAKGSERFTIIF